MKTENGPRVLVVDDEPSIVDAVERFEARPLFRGEVCRRNALRFTAERFKHEFMDVVERAMHDNKGFADTAPALQYRRSA